MIYRASHSQVLTGGADSLVLVYDRSRHEAQESRRLDQEVGLSLTPTPIATET